MPSVGRRSGSCAYRPLTHLAVLICPSLITENPFFKTTMTPGGTLPAGFTDLLRLAGPNSAHAVNIIALSLFRATSRIQFC